MNANLSSVVAYVNKSMVKKWVILYIIFIVIYLVEMEYNIGIPQKTKFSGMLHSRRKFFTTQP